MTPEGAESIITHPAERLETLANYMFNNKEVIKIAKAMARIQRSASSMICTCQSVSTCSAS